MNLRDADITFRGVNDLVNENGMNLRDKYFNLGGWVVLTDIDESELSNRYSLLQGLSLEHLGFSHDWPLERASGDLGDADIPDLRQSHTVFGGGGNQGLVHASLNDFVVFQWRSGKVAHHWRSEQLWSIGSVDHNFFIDILNFGVKQVFDFFVEALLNIEFFINSEDDSWGVGRELILNFWGFKFDDWDPDWLEEGWLDVVVDWLDVFDDWLFNDWKGSSWLKRLSNDGLSNYYNWSFYGSLVRLSNRDWFNEHFIWFLGWLLWDFKRHRSDLGLIQIDWVRSVNVDWNFDVDLIRIDRTVFLSMLTNKCWVLSHMWINRNSSFFSLNMWWMNNMRWLNSDGSGYSFITSDLKEVNLALNSVLSDVVNVA